MKKSLAIASALLFAGSAAPSRAADIAGVWLTQNQDARIRMAKCGPGLCGTIVWLKTPKDPKTGKPPTDVNNKNPALRARRMIGLMIAINFVPSSSSPGKLSGHFYNADDGNTYDGNVYLASANELKAEGCLLGICQAQSWTRVK